MSLCIHQLDKLFHPVFFSFKTYIWHNQSYVNLFEFFCIIWNKKESQSVISTISKLYLQFSFYFRFFCILIDKRYLMSKKSIYCFVQTKMVSNTTLIAPTCQPWQKYPACHLFPSVSLFFYCLYVSKWNWLLLLKYYPSGNTSSSQGHWWFTN